jgi:hypothetical protein
LSVNSPRRPGWPETAAAASGSACRSGMGSEAEGPRRTNGKLIR